MGLHGDGEGSVDAIGKIMAGEGTTDDDHNRPEGLTELGVREVPPPDPNPIGEEARRLDRRLTTVE